MSEPTRTDITRAYAIVNKFNATRAALVATVLDPMSADAANRLAASLVRSDVLRAIADEIRAARESSDGS